MCLGRWFLSEAETFYCLLNQEEPTGFELPQEDMEDPQTVVEFLGFGGFLEEFHWEFL